MFWSLYFFTKLALLLSGNLQLQWWANSVLAVLVFWPIRQPTLRRWRAGLMLLLAIGLVYAESHLPSLPRLIEQVHNLSNFSAQYTLELLMRLMNPNLLLAVLAVFLLWVLNRWLRIPTLAFLAVLLVPPSWQLIQWRQLQSHLNQTQQTHNSPFDANPQAALQNFWSQQAKLHVQWPSESSVPFDLLVLHICSLSWDDLKFSQQIDNPLLSRFDVVFDKFDTSTTYSGPAMLRLLRADCGQSPHDALYGLGPPGCGLYRNLQTLGFEVQAVLNHDGQFDHFAHTLGTELGVTVQTPVSTAEVPIAMYSFDDSPIANDYAVLSTWWQNRQTLPNTAPQALYYNTISLHDGNRLPGTDQSALQTYGTRLRQLLTDIDRFIDVVASSGRPVVMVFIPEHGAALRTDEHHVAGVRETPLPDITHVPVAIKFLGWTPRTQNPQTVHVSQPSSYFTLATLLAQLMEQPELMQNTDSVARDMLVQKTRALPSIDFLADNGETLVARGSQGLWLRTAQGTWQYRANTP